MARTFREGLKINKLHVVSLLELAKLILLVLAIVFCVVFFVKFFFDMQPLLNSIDAIRTTGATADLFHQFSATKYLFSQFLWKSILLVVVTTILCSIITGAFDSLIVSNIKDKKYKIRYWLDFGLHNLILTTLFLIIEGVILYFSTSVLMLFILFILVYIIYIYIWTVYQLFIEEKKPFWKNLLKCYLNALKFYRIITLLLIIILAIIIALIIIILSVLLLHGYYIILAIILLLLISVWSRNYIYTYYRSKKIL